MTAKQTDPINMGEREVNIEQYLRRQCLSRKWDCEKLDPTNKRGIQDRLVLPGGGLVYFVELKRNKGPIRSLQSRRLYTMVERGYSAYIIQSKDEVDGLINRIESELRSQKISASSS